MNSAMRTFCAESGAQTARRNRRRKGRMAEGEMKHPARPGGPGKNCVVCRKPGGKTKVRNGKRTWRDEESWRLRSRTVRFLQVQLRLQLKFTKEPYGFPDVRGSYTNGLFPGTNSPHFHFPH